VNHRTRSLACDGLRALAQSPQVGRITRLSPSLTSQSDLPQRCGHLDVRMTHRCVNSAGADSAGSMT